MARVAVAYVEVRPELMRGFRANLKTQLEAVNETVKVKVDVDAQGMTGAVSKAMAKTEQVAANSAAAMQKINDKMLAAEVDSVIREQTAMQAERLRIQQAGVNERVAVERHANSLLRAEEKGGLKETLRQVSASNRLREALAGLSARNEVKQRLRIQNLGVSAEVNRQRAVSRLQGRIAADAFADSFSAGWSRVTRLTQEEIDHFETVMVDRFGAVGGATARAFARRFNRDVDKELERRAGRTAQGYIRRFSDGLSRGGTISRVFVRPLLNATAGIGDAVGSVVSGTFKQMGKLGEMAASGLSSLGGVLGDLAEKFPKFAGVLGSAASGLGQLGATVSSLATSLAGAAGPVGAVVAAVVAVSLAATLASVAIVALNAVLGALLAVIIPLVAGITALVAQLTALAGVGVGAIGLLPGLLGAAAAAFGPLLLVMDKFQDLFEDTSKKTGSLFSALEQLKNAIWAVLGTGFVQEILRFAKDVLPQLLGGIEAVSSAWGRLLTGLVKLASTQGALDAFNALLAQGAKLVDFFAQVIGVLGPALLTMAVAAQPALTSMLGVVSTLVDTFGAWVAEMAASGQLTTFFNQIAGILGQLALLLPPLASLMTTWIVNLLPPVSQFVGLLSAMVQRWVTLATSAEGMAMIQGFFLAMNRIVATFEPLLEQVVTTFLQFGPTLASLTEAAMPALMVLVTTLTNLATAVAPAVMGFLSAFAAALSDPQVQESVTQLGLALGELLTAFTANHEMWQSVITMLAGLARVFAPIVEVAVALFGALTPLTNVMFSLLIPALDQMMVLMQPLISLLEWFGKASNESAAQVERWASKLNLIKGPLTWLGKKLGLVGDDATAMGTDTANASSKSIGAMNALANAKAWNVIATNQQAIGQYAVDSANLGIAANERYINSLNAMGAAAYSAKNEVDIATFEKNVGRAMNKQFKLQRATSSKSGAKLGTVFGDAYNDAVSTKFDVATKKSKQKGKRTAAGWISNFKATLPKLSGFEMISHQKSFDTGREVARYVAKGLTSGTTNINRVTRYIEKNFSKQLTSMVGKNKAFWDKQKSIAAKALPDWNTQFKKFTSGKQLDAYLVKWQNHWTDRLNAIVDFKNKVKDTLTQGANLVGYFGFIPTPQEVQARLDAVKQQMTDFTTGLAELQKRGLSKELAAEWLMAGPEQAANLVQGLAGATRTELENISKGYAGLLTSAETQADAAATQYFGVGQSTVEGYIAGIKSMRTIASSEMTGLIDYVYKQVKTKLGIKSPSTVFAGLGVNTMAGYIEGVAGMQSDTVTAVNKVYDAVTKVPPATLPKPTVKPGYVKPGAVGTDALTSTPHVVNVRVFLGDRELTDLVRTEVDGVDTRKARMLLAGRRGG